MQAFATTDRYLETRAQRGGADALADHCLSLTPGYLSEQETEFARTAWCYFANFTRQPSGLAPTTADVDTISPWDMGATLIAITVADLLGIITPNAAKWRMSLCLETLAGLRLGPTHLPKQHYFTKAPVNRASADRRADGWSAVGVMRLVSGFIVAAHHYPAFAPEISMILGRWNLHKLLDKGRFRSGEYQTGGAPKPAYVSDAYLGYEQYAARAACLINLPAGAALDPRPVMRGRLYDGILLPGDRRLDRRTQPVITSEPFCLEALEFGWRRDMLDVALTLYLAQKQRFEHTGTLTALTEDALDQPPGFAWHGVLAGERPFTSLASDGRDISHLRCLSAKAAFCWWALIPGPYSQKLLDAISDLGTDKGWQTGIYERGGQINSALSLNTNAVILEALHYKALGPLFPTADTAP